MNFHEQLHAARKAQGMNQDQLAEAMNVSRATVSHWENGRHLPDIETLQRLTEVLQCEFVPLTKEEMQQENDDSTMYTDDEQAEHETVPPEVPTPAPENNPRPLHPLSLLIGFCAGAIVCLAVMLFVVPLFETKPAPAAANPVVTSIPAAEKSSMAWFKQAVTPEDGQAFIKISAGTDSVKAVKNNAFGNGAGCFTMCI